VEVVVGWVADCTSLPAIADLKAAEVESVARYLGPQDLSKVISRSEVELLAREGIGLILVWENFAKDWMSGAYGGLVDSREAVRQANALGYPLGSCIYGACDFDLTAADWRNGCQGYASTFKGEVTRAGYTAGVYGPYDAIELCKELGFDFFWQSMSHGHSQGRNVWRHSVTNLWQQWSVKVGETETDYNAIITANYGQIGKKDDMSWKDVIRTATVVAVGSPTTEGYTESMGETEEEKALSKGNAELYDTYNLRSVEARLTAAIAKLKVEGGNVDTSMLETKMDALTKQVDRLITVVKDMGKAVGQDLG
jgi:hypothetical protein